MAIVEESIMMGFAKFSGFELFVMVDSMLSVTKTSDLIEYTIFFDLVPNL